jgi:4-hydroxybenzoate polyprenyltransferase
MMYFWCWLCPWLAQVVCDKPGQALISLCLTVFSCGAFYPFSIVWGYLTVFNYYADERTDRLVAAIEDGAAATVQAIKANNRKRPRVEEEVDENPFDFS